MVAAAQVTKSYRSTRTRSHVAKTVRSSHDTNADHSHADATNSNNNQNNSNQTGTLWFYRRIFTKYYTNFVRNTFSRLATVKGKR